MRTGFLSKADAWHALNSSILESLEHPVVATAISQKGWEHIMTPSFELASLGKGVLVIFRGTSCVAQNLFRVSASSTRGAIKN